MKATAAFSILLHIFFLNLFEGNNIIYTVWVALQAFNEPMVLIDFSLTEKAATLIFISGRGSAISSAKQEKSGSVYNLVKNVGWSGPLLVAHTTLIETSCHG